ncbi:MAG: class I ribonucleotide reductase maintenance protein YfaE [Alteromonadaceae bacterium]|mgnify:CR=1
MNFFNITIGEGKSIQSSPNHTILESLEHNEIEVHYHCRDGFCGACRVKLKKGTIRYPQGDPLAYVDDDEILTCCSLPSSDIEIEID